MTPSLIERLDQPSIPDGGHSNEQSGRQLSHTPTPWRVFTTSDGLKLLGVGDSEGGGILDSGFGVWSWMHAEGIANAELVVRAVNNHGALLKALETAIRVADEARIEWDRAPNGMKAGKLLIALSDPSLTYRADITEMHAALASAKGSAQP